ncbi:MAG TPA: DUF2752 domain-containing protein [Bacteroidia bacterium]
MNKKVQLVLISGLLVFPLVLLLLPANFFDTGQSFCLSKLMLDQECPGCGITRGIQHLIHLDFKEAYSFNKLSFIVLPVLVFVWFKEVISVYKKIKT